jgi:Zn ribbon nucleic-acid-binding protein
MTLTDFMFGPLSIRVSVACPKCEREPTVVIYRYVGAVALRCIRCGHQWSERWAEHPVLKDLFTDEKA